MQNPFKRIKEAKRQRQAQFIEECDLCARVDEAKKWRRLINRRDAWWLKQIRALKAEMQNAAAIATATINPPEIQPGPGARLVDVDPEDFQQEVERLWDGGGADVNALAKRSKFTPLDRMLAALKHSGRPVMDRAKLIEVSGVTGGTAERAIAALKRTPGVSTYRDGRHVRYWFAESEVPHG